MCCRLCPASWRLFTVSGEVFKLKTVWKWSFRGCHFHKLCGGYIIYRLCSSKVHIGWLHVLFSFYRQLATLPWWVLLLENDTPDLFQTATSTMVHTCPLSTHSHKLRRPSHCETTIVCLTCYLDDDIAPKGANRVHA